MAVFGINFDMSIENGIIYRTAKSRLDIDLIHRFSSQIQSILLFRSTISRILLFLVNYVVVYFLAQQGLAFGRCSPGIVNFGSTCHQACLPLPIQRLSPFRPHLLPMSRRIHIPPPLALMEIRFPLLVDQTAG